VYLCSGMLLLRDAVINQPTLGCAPAFRWDFAELVSLDWVIIYRNVILKLHSCGRKQEMEGTNEQFRLPKIHSKTLLYTLLKQMTLNKWLDALK
jgi:hypothetical protein